MTSTPQLAQVNIARMKAPLESPVTGSLPVSMRSTRWRTEALVSCGACKHMSTVQRPSPSPSP